jgi:hypothetical protein
MFADLSRRHFLFASAAAAAIARPVRAQATTRPDHVIVVLARGGWDTTYALDPKMDVELIEGPVTLNEAPGDEEYVADLHDNIRIQCNDYRRPAVKTFFENWGHRAALINGQFVGSITHEPCRLRILTGTSDHTKPDFVTIFGSVYGTDLPLGSIDFSAHGFPGPLASTTGRVGANNQLRALLDPDTFHAPPPGMEQLPLRRLSGTEQDLVRDYLERRADAYEAAVADAGANARHLAALRDSLERRERLRDVGPELVGDLTIGELPSFSQQASLAVDLVTKGLCRAITLRDTGQWDTHRGNSEQHALHQHFFTVLDQLAADLEAADMLDRTLVYVCSEMARTPRLNSGGGKDHWGHTSQILLGGGVNGGKRFGGTDEYGEGQWVDYASGEVYAKGERIKYDNVVAGILQTLDIDSQAWLPGVEAFGPCFSV